MLSEMRKSTIVEFLIKNGYKESFSNGYVYYHLGRSNFVSLGRPRNIKGRSEDECWSAHVWIKGEYDGKCYYHYEDFCKRIHLSVPFYRLK